MNKKNCNILIFGAHPDDAERQMGGTIAHLVAHGNKVTIISLTAGQMGTFGDVATRKREFEQASKILGASGHILDCMDTEVTTSIENRLKIVHQIRIYKPDIIFAPFPGRGSGLYGNAAHPDHSSTGQLVLDAIPLANMAKRHTTEPHRISQLMYYMLPEEIVPNVFIPLSNSEWAQAVEAASSYVSQSQSFSGSISLAEYLTSQRRMHRKMGVVLPEKYELAEGFFHSSPFIMTSQTLNNM